MATRRKGLGRGLDALLTDRSGRQVDTSATPSGEGVQSLQLELLDANQKQPRTEFEKEKLEELAQSIRAQGVIQPVIVQSNGEGRYLILAGERRTRAARLAGLTEIPALVRRDPLDDSQVLQLALVENLQRADLNVLEEARAFQQLREVHGMTQDEIARQVGRSRSAVANHLRLLKLPGPILELLAAGRLTAGQARPLLSLPKTEDQQELAATAADGGLSAREIESLVAASLAPEGTTRDSSSSKGASQEQDVNTRKAAERLTRALQTKVEIRRTRRGGTVRVHFHSEEELIRLFDLMTRT